MKTMTCKQLGGACDMEFTANTFDEIVQMSKLHGLQMFQKNDTQHLEAMQRIQVLLQDPIAMQKWFEDKKVEFENLEDN